MIVVKVGGSLYGHPHLRSGLKSFLNQLNDHVLIVPGGGAAGAAVREWDRIHNLGEEASHWIAIRSLSQTAMMLAGLLHVDFDKPAAQARGDGFALACAAGLNGNEIGILNVESWMREHDTLPHTWAVTSDSIAALAAREMNAARLILLKSIDVPADVSWPVAAANGWVDEHFPIIAKQLQCPVEIVNFHRIAAFPVE